MSNHCERISSTAWFFHSTLTFDFREASLPLSQDRFKAAQFTTTNFISFIINTIVLMLENQNFRSFYQAFMNTAALYFTVYFKFEL